MSPGPKRRFSGVLQGSDDSSATYVLVPAAVMKTFGGRVRVPVRMTINGVEHRTTVCNMGLGPMRDLARALGAAERRAFDPWAGAPKAALVADDRFVESHRLTAEQHR